jgi:hypothetical protein
MGRYHAILSIVLAIPGAFFLSNTYHSVWSCGINQATDASGCGYVPEYDFLSIGLLLAFLAAIECVMAIQRRRTGATVWETSRQVATRRLGIIMTLIGAVLAAYGLYGVYEVMFYGGMITAAIGAALVLGAAFWRIKPEKWRDQIVLPTAA